MNSTSMASTSCALPALCGSSTAKSLHCALSNPATLQPRTPKIGPSTLFPQLARSFLSPWSGLRRMGTSIRQKSLEIANKRKCRGKVVYASLFGVGAPEALVIGVVALLVFGPKGLAEVARNLGKTLRAFQPTIRELQEVSREFKSSLEREIGLDDIQSSTQNTYSSKYNNSTSTLSPTSGSEDSEASVDPNGVPSPNEAYSSEDYLKITEEQLKASAAKQQEQPPPPTAKQLEPQSQPQAAVQDAAFPSTKGPHETSHEKQAE